MEALTLQGLLYITGWEQGTLLVLGLTQDSHNPKLAFLFNKRALSCPINSPAGNK